MNESFNSPLNSQQRSEKIRRVIHDCVHRRNEGKPVSDADLIASNADLMPELAEQLKALHLIEKAERAADGGTEIDQRGLHIRCPNCSHPVEIIEDVPLTNVSCPTCGSRFSLVGEHQSFAAEQLKTIGHFELLDKLGVGAFGSVWSARDIELDRIVAVKIPRQSQLRESDCEQFIREARTAAKLNHPNIVRVYEVGRHEDRVFIVSDLIQGVDLAEWLTDRRATPREAAELCLKVADALHYAHQQGVIHRDLKPDNIMLDTRGAPHVMDFGLAKREAGEITITMDGKLVGTPAYMSPEQARGSAHQADRRSDVYSLGVILYELLTGERPFRGSTRMLLHQVLVEDAPSPRRLNSSIPKDLGTITTKCLEKAPKARYQSANELSDDLRRFLNGEPVHARPITRPARVWRWCKRQPLVAGLCAAVIGLLLTLSIAGPILAMNQAWLRFLAQRAAQDAELAAARETEAKQRFRRMLYISDMDSAREAWDRNESDHALKLLKRYVPYEGEEDLREWEWRYLWRLCNPSTRRQSFRHGDHPVTDVVISKDGKQIISVSRQAVRQWQADPFHQIREQPLDPSGMINGVLSADGQLVAFGHEDGSLTLINRQSGLKRTVRAHRDNVRVWNQAFSPSGDVLASGAHDGSVMLWGSPTLDPLPTLGGHADAVTCLAFSPDGRTLASASWDQTVKLWDVKSGALKRTLDIDSHCEIRSEVWSVAFSPDGKLVATGTSGENVIHLWNAESGKLIREQSKHLFPIRCLAFSPNVETLACGEANGTVILSDVASGDFRARIFANSYHIRCLEFSRGRNVLISGDQRGFVNSTDLESLPKQNVLRGHGARVHGVAFSADDKWLASGSLDGEIKLWNLESREEAFSVKGHESGVVSLSFSPREDMLASASWDKKVKLWQLNNGKLRELNELPHDNIVASVAFSPDGSTLASGSGKTLESGGVNGTVTLWDRVTVEKIGTLSGHGALVCALAFSPDGATLASACSNDPSSSNVDHDVRLWNLKNRKLERVLIGHADDVLTLAFSPDGRFLASAGYDGSMRRWSMVDRTKVKILPVTQQDIFSVRFSPDGTSLIAAGFPGTEVVIWDPHTFDVRFKIPAHRDVVRSMEVSHDGTIIATGSGDDTIKLWQAATSNSDYLSAGTR